MDIPNFPKAVLMKIGGRWEVQFCNNWQGNLHLYKEWTFPSELLADDALLKARFKWVGNDPKFGNHWQMWEKM